MPKIKTKKFNKSGEVAAPSAKLTGVEPSWEDASSLSLDEYLSRRWKAMTFYSMHVDPEDLSGDAIAFMENHGFTKSQTSTWKNIPKQYLTGTALRVARLINRGMPPKHVDDKSLAKPWDEGASEQLHAMIIEQIQRSSEASTIKHSDEKEEVLSPDLSRAVREEVESIIDEWTTNSGCAIRCPSMKSIIDGQYKTIPKSEYPKIIDLLQSHLHSYEEALERCNEQVREAWSYLNKPALKKRCEYLETMINEVNSLTSTKRKSNVRQKKPVDTTKRLKHLPSHEEFGSSKNIKSIPTSSFLIAFNVKSRRIKFLYAKSGGFIVGGSTIKNLDDEKSFEILLRKPADTLPHFRNAPPDRTDSLIAKHLKTKKGKTNGRLTNDHLITRIQ